MKKLLLLIFIFILTGCNINKKNYISKMIELDISNCKIETYIDTHQGFLGDGDSFAKINCSSKINISKNYKELPLSDSIKEVLDMEQCNQDDCKNVFSKYNIPTIENGYYYFKDRNSKNIYDDSTLNNRSSYNFNIAIYDTLNNIIYYYELDT